MNEKKNWLRITFMSITSVVNVPDLIKGFLVFVQYIWGKKEKLYVKFDRKWCFRHCFLQIVQQKYICIHLYNF